MVPGCRVPVRRTHRQGASRVSATSARIVGISTYGSPRSYVLAGQRQRATDPHAERSGCSCGLRTRTTWLGLYGSTRPPRPNGRSSPHSSSGRMADVCDDPRARRLLPSRRRRPSCARSAIRWSTTARRRGRRGTGRRPLRRRVRPDVQRDRIEPRTSSPAPTRRCSDTSTTSGGATPSCSSTRRGGRVSRRCSRAGSTGSGSTAWRGTSLPGSDRIERRLTQRAPPRRGDDPRFVEVRQRDRGREREAHDHPKPPVDVSPTRAAATWIAMYGVDASSRRDRARFLDRVDALRKLA